MAGGLTVPETPDLAAPVRVLPDFSDLDDPQFFVARVGLDLPSPEPGDLIVAVNDRPIPEYVAEFTQWIRHSTRYGLYWHMARELPLMVRNVPPQRYAETLNLTLEDGRRRPLRRVPALRGPRHARPSRWCRSTRDSNR